MDTLHFEIARFFAAKAIQQRRTTYQQLGEAVGWSHPTGRGLGRNLEVILRYLHDQGLPPLTTILVQKGERYPAEDAMAYIRAVLGKDVDIDAEQRRVFEFDWSSIPELTPNNDTLPLGRDIWLTSFWGSTPQIGAVLDLQMKQRDRDF